MINIEQKLQTVDIPALNLSRAKSLSLYMSLALLAVMCAFPFVYPDQREPIAGFYHEWLAIIFGLWAFLVSLSSLMGEGLRLPRVAWLPLALLAVLGLQLLFQPQVFSEHIQLGAAYLLWAALLMMLGYNLPQQLELKRVVAGLALGLVVGGLVLTGQEFMFRFAWGVTHKWGGLGQRNLYGDYLSLGWVDAVYGWVTLKQQHSKWALAPLGLAVLLILGLSLSPSCGIWLFALAVLVLTGFGGFPEKRRLLTVMAGLLSLLAAAQWFWASAWAPALPGLDPVRMIDQHVFLELDGLPIRLHLWRSAWDLFLQSPVLGQGLGQFDWAYFSAGQGFPGLTDRLEDTHNLLMQLLVELGVLPVVLLFAVVGVWLAGFVKTTASLEKWWLAALLLILAVHSLFDDPLWNAEFLGLAALLLGMGEQKAYDLQLNAAGKLGVWLGICLLIGLSFSQRNAYKRLEAQVYDMQIGLYNWTMSGFMNNMQQIAKDAPGLAPYVNVIFNGFIQLQDGDNASNLKMGDAALRFMPGPYLAYRQALMLAVASKQAEAEAMLKLALASYPDSAAEFVKDINGYSPAIQKKAKFLVGIINAREGK